MSIFSLKPSRPGSKEDDSLGPVADLDALVTEPVPFRLHGKIWKIRPVTTVQLFQVMDKLAGLEQLRLKAETVTPETIVKGYFELFHAVCPELSIDDVGDMSQAQCLSLLQLIVDSVSGKAQVELEKKKKAGRESNASAGSNS